MTEKMIAIGIVSSAGGLEAVSGLIQNLPPTPNVFYVLAQHMSPSHESLLSTLLARETRLTVQQLSGATTPQADTIYVTPPNSDVFLQDGQLVLGPPSGHPASPKPSGDRLLKSLAHEMGENTVAIILSGTGSDGSYGVQAIREAGGITIAQDAVSAKYDGMPVAAVATGCVDLTLTPQQIGQHLAKILSSPRDLNSLRVETAPVSRMSELMRILMSRTRVDFRDYKETTLRRRIHRRMSALGVTDYDDYVALCRGSPDEVDALHRDLLISVTRFFRDPDQFEALQEAIYDLVDRAPDGSFRVWVPGVATGEEAYTIAILFAEAMGGLSELTKGRLQIFGTDIDVRALSLARTGLYPLSAMQDVPEKLRDRYFRKSQDKVEVRRDLRAAILFSEHNVARDPPFLNLDLVSLRNVLIYFNNSLQERVLSRIHYGLSERGMLFLGTSETASGMEAWFEQSSLSTKLYVKRAGQRPGQTAPGVLSPLAPMSGAGYSLRPPTQAGKGPFLPGGTRDEAFETLLKVVAPLGFLTTRNGDILRVFGDISGFIELSNASALRMNTRLLKPTFSEEAVNLIAVAARRGQRVSGDWHVQDPPRVEARLSCYPLHLPDASEETYIFSIEQRERMLSPMRDLESLSEGDRLAYVQDLEREMSATREALQQTVEELKTSNEELQSTNEELQSTNEELQATNEELETANEELQSTNEELITVNEEMRISAEELHRLSLELQASFEATIFPTLMVDEALLIRHASKSAMEFLGIRALPAHGLHLSQCPLPEGLPSAIKMCNDALRNGRPEVATVTSLEETIQVTAAPFQASDAQVGGLAISIQRFEYASLNALMDAMGEMGGVSHWMLDLVGRRLHWAEGVFDIHGRDRAAGEPTLEQAIACYHPDDRETVSAAIHSAIETGTPLAFEARVVRQDTGRSVRVRALGTPVLDSAGRVIKLVGAFADIEADIHSEILLDHFAQVQDLLGVGFYFYDIANSRPSWSRGLTRLLGYDPDTHTPTVAEVIDILHPDDRDAMTEHMRRAIETGQSFSCAARVRLRDGSFAPCSARGDVRRNPEGTPTHVYGSFHMGTDGPQAPSTGAGVK